MRFTMFIAVAAAVLSTGNARAQSPEETVKAEIDSAFAEIDTDKDKSISRDEFGVFMEKTIAQQVVIFEKSFAELDPDKDGKISREESAANTALEANFGQVDTNSDGFLSKEELAAAMRAAQQATAAK